MIETTMPYKRNFIGRVIGGKEEAEVKLLSKEVRTKFTAEVTILQHPRILESNN